MPKSRRSEKTRDVWNVQFTQSAEDDVEAIIDFIAEREGVERAEKILQLFREAKNSLSAFPVRGHFPPELLRLHISEFREIHAGVYRFVYQTDTSTKQVFIHAVFDGRRHVDEILSERIFRFLEN
jgi:toxin ParE1/3/4